MLNDISNRERFDILVEEFCGAIGIQSEAEKVKNHQAFLANDHRCQLEFNASFDPDRAYVFVQAKLADSNSEKTNLKNEASVIADGELGYVQPENDRWIFAVVPFPLIDTDVDGLKIHVFTAIQGAESLQQQK